MKYLIELIKELVGKENAVVNFLRNHTTILASNKLT